MLRHADRAHPRPAAAVGDAEGLVQVEMRHVRPEPARQTEAQQGVEVGAVHVDLAAGRMDHRADLDDGFLEHAMRGGVGDHQRRQVLRMGLGLGAQVGEVDVAIVVAGDHLHRHPGHHGARRVGAMRRARDQADVAPLLAAALVIAADHQEPGVLPLAAGVGLQRDGGEAGDRAQHPLQPCHELAIARRLPGRREGVDAAEAGPRDRHHLGGRVELHGAGAERDHRLIEGEVLSLQACACSAAARSPRGSC